MNMISFMIHAVFYVFALLTIVAASMVVFSSNPMRSILSLIVCFVTTAVLWLLCQAEFLAMVLIFVYVGAVMTLFLFVVMMLHVDLIKLKEGFVRYVPYAALIMLALLGMLVLVFMPGAHYPWGTLSVMHHPQGYSNTQQLGEVLYTHYVLSFELAGVILLVAMVASISLAFAGRKPGTKAQRIAQQLEATKATRLSMVDLPAKLQGEAHGRSL